MRRTCAVLILGAFIAGCAANEQSNYVREGVEYGVTQGVFRGRWWSYYERGTSFLAGKYYDEALADFEQALAGRNRDSWRARTYGLHFVEYFPNRELGITLFHLGRLDEAEQYLNASLAEIDTERAHFYIDEIKRARIASGALRDNTAPAITTSIVVATALAAPEIRVEEPAPAPAPEPVTPEPKPEPTVVPIAKEEPEPAPAPKPEPKPAPVAKAEPTPAPESKPEPEPTPEPKPEPKAEPAPEPEVTTAAATPEPVAEPEPAAESQPAPAPAEAPAVVEAPKPEPQVLPAAAPTIVADNTIEVGVNASDDTGVVCVMVNKEMFYQRQSVESQDYKKEVELEEGTHTLEVESTDLAEKVVKQEVAVTVDTTGPTLGVFSPIEPTVTEYGTVQLEGSTVDKNGVTNVNVDERLLAESPGAPRLPFNSELPLGDGENTFILAARDVAGNETRSTVKVFKGDPDSAEAKLWLIKEKYPDRLQFALADPARITPAFLDAILAQGDAEKAQQKIRVKSPTLDKPYHHSRSVQVSGDVVTQSKVSSILINGVPFTDLTGAPKESFNRRIPIKPEELVNGKGSKAISIVATDANGNEIREEFSVAIEVVGLNDPQYRMPVAVLGFQGFGVSDDTPAAVQYALGDSLVERKRFRVLDRTQIQTILQEQQIAADLSNPDEAMAIGSVVPAQLVLTGAAFRQEGGLELKARVISTETAEVVDTLDAFVEDASQPGALAQGCGKLADLFAHRFPRVTGQVSSVRGAGDQFEINLTEEDNVRPGSYVLLVYKEPDEVDPENGEVIWRGTEKVLGRARIERVTETGSQAVMVEVNQEGVPVEEGMPAVTM